MINQIEPYFSVKWSNQKTANEAFEEAKLALIKVKERDIAEINALDFDKFAQKCCHPSVLKSSRRE